ncbi:uncharacterized protein LOC124441717 [Xenia sp. Carnegie-2017]|uniref:uncharacterized protein LOC124441717 n=1 Tax=Xenia sp. Carnegie-2017 TaxID=2897299 RepID=UPI001F04C784|nr:uncharacterized protein LOC124441717 [Xenia sp. Carnegie-2017]
MEFFPLNDNSNRSLCDFLMSGVKDSKWTQVFVFPLSLPNITQGNRKHGDRWIFVDSKTSGDLRVYLNGLSFSRNTGNNLFAWGNIFCYSPNAGEDFLWLLDCCGQKSNITMFTSAEDGSYSFLNDLQQIWWGHTDFAFLHYLETANKWNVGLMTVGNICKGSHKILSMFFDSFGKLWKVVKCDNQTSKFPCILKRKVAILDILSHSHLIKEQTSLDHDIHEISTILEHGVESLSPKHCLTYSIVYEAPYTSRYLQQVVDIVDVPHMVNTLPVSIDFLKKYLKNQRASLINPRAVKQSMMKHSLPKRIYLTKGETYNFTVTLTLDDSKPNYGNVFWSIMDHMILSHKVSDLSSLNVTAIRAVFRHKRTVKYQFSLKDSGLFPGKTAPGIALRPVHFQVQPWLTDGTCVKENTGKGVLQGTESMTVLLGCPPSMKVVFDPEATVKASGKNQFCNEKNGIACFLFDLTFYPVFNIVDGTTGNTSVFTGKYQLRIVGGGKKINSIREYDDGEIARYNFHDFADSTSSLIWTPKEKNLASLPSFNMSNNGFQWLCGRTSPCSQISPVFPNSPEFFFKIEFSNRHANDESLNCDLTAQFIIRIHGLPLGSLYPATVIVATCMAIITAYVLAMFSLTRDNHKQWNMIRDFFQMKKNSALIWIRRRFNVVKIRPTPDHFIEECGGKDVGCGILRFGGKTHTASSSVTEFTT